MTSSQLVAKTFITNDLGYFYPQKWKGKLQSSLFAEKIHSLGAWCMQIIRLGDMNTSLNKISTVPSPAGRLRPIRAK
jgi:hypothetical protein